MIDWDKIKTTYKRFKGGDLPESAAKFLEKAGAEFGGYVEAWYEGADPEIATRWIITIDNGWYYKVGAEYMTWYYGIKNPDEIVGKCNWSGYQLGKTLQAILSGVQPPYDPDYQT